MKVKVTVLLDGKKFFTAFAPLKEEEDVTKLAAIMLIKFPEEEGFHVTVQYVRQEVITLNADDFMRKLARQSKESEEPELIN